MTTDLTLFGYGHSVYTWMARMALNASGAAWQDREVNPFDAPTVVPHPFQRVPLLEHGALHLYETGAITRYVDRVFGAARLTPRSAVAQARMDQVIGIVDSYAYIPLIRQVFAHAVFRPWLGEPSVPGTIDQGLSDAVPVLTALNEIAAEGHVLTGGNLTLADCHLGPVMAYFTAAPAGRAMLEDHAALDAWWTQQRRVPSLRETWPKGPVPPP